MITPSIRFAIARPAVWSFGWAMRHATQHGLSWLFGIYAFQLREVLSDTSAGVYVDPFDATQNSTTLDRRLECKASITR